MNIRILFFAFICTYNAYATEVWLHNGYKTPIEYSLNQQAPKTIGAGNRVFLAVHEKTNRGIILHPAISSLSVRTTKTGSLPHNLLSKIKEVITSTTNNSALESKNAVLMINPNPVIWDIKISWEEPTRQTWQTQEQGWQPTGQNYAQSQQSAQQQYLEKMAAFFRTSSAEQIMNHIINNNLLGPEYAQKTAVIYNAASYNQNNQNYTRLYWNIINFIKSIKQIFANEKMNPDEKLDSLITLKDHIDTNYKMYQIYLP